MLELLDLRHLRETGMMHHEYSDTSTETAEHKIIKLAMSMIMKMNDKTFRPIFVNLVDWATTPLSNDNKVEGFRMISFFKFYEAFNDQLKVRDCFSRRTSERKCNCSLGDSYHLRNIYH